MVNNYTLYYWQWRISDWTKVSFDPNNQSSFEFHWWAKTILNTKDYFVYEKLKIKNKNFFYLSVKLIQLVETFRQKKKKEKINFFFLKLKVICFTFEWGGQFLDCVFCFFYSLRCATRCFFNLFQRNQLDTRERLNVLFKTNCKLNVF